MMSLMLLAVTGCEWLGITSPEDSGNTIEINGDNNEVNIDDNDINGDGDINNDDCGDCGDLDSITCYSIPSCDPRECSGCTIGVNCTVNEPSVECSDSETENTAAFVIDPNLLQNE